LPRLSSRSTVNRKSSIVDFMKRVYLSLGSNLSDRQANLEKAVQQLGDNRIEVRRVSSLYRTEPVGYAEQPWFLNCVAEVMTDLMPLQLVRRCQGVERELGRRPGPKNGPRLIDIDILLYENAVVHSPEVTIPHPRMAERRFVLVPLAELAPALEDPVSGLRIREMLQATRDKSQVVKLQAQLASRGREWGMRYRGRPNIRE
jgi:2-amino-4-hydroxy-6-hydroxymethyldihydropteridine diphosphokinase